jgi:hypothetical protein
MARHLPSVIMISLLNHFCSRNRIVDIVTRLQAGRLRNRGRISGRREGYFCTNKRRKELWGPPNLLFNGYQGLFFSVVKRPGRAEVKNVWHYNFTPPYTFMACTVTTLTILSTFYSSFCLQAIIFRSSVCSKCSVSVEFLASV